MTSAANIKSFVCSLSNSGGDGMRFVHHTTNNRAAANIAMHTSANSAEPISAERRSPFRLRVSLMVRPSEIDLPTLRSITGALLCSWPWPSKTGKAPHEPSYPLKQDDKKWCDCWKQAAKGKSP